MTAPRPRVEGEELSVAEARKAFNARGIADTNASRRILAGLEARDEARATVARLTAEVERLRGVVDRAINHGQSAQQYSDYEAWRRSWKVFRDEIALPTPAPEATE